MTTASSRHQHRPKAAADHRAQRAGRYSRIVERLLGLHTRSRRVISEHRHRRKLRDREVSDRSRRGLDWTNFFLADVQMSFGSFLAFYLADLGWSKQNVGLALRPSCRKPSRRNTSTNVRQPTFAAARDRASGWRSPLAGFSDADRLARERPMWEP
jgi:hypothetical protein